MVTTVQKLTGLRQYLKFITFKDVDECTVGAHNCHSQATCSNTIGLFTCTCNEGYTGDGTRCEDINECVGKSRKCSGAGQECFNFPGAYRCNCISPRQQIIDGECTDIQASVEGQFVIINLVYIPAYNDPQSVEYFQITQLLTVVLTNLYTRTARLRFTFQSIIILRLFQGSLGFDYVATFNDSAGITNENIQEELVESMNVTQNGTFLGADLQISESTNLTEVKSQFSVKDYDECNPQNSIHTPDCGNNALCRNTNTSYECICHSGYEKNNTGCIDVDECALDTDNCHNQATCKNTNGSFTCTCNEGYTGNGTTCEDVDECTLGTRNCDSKATCSNTIGSFICTCNDGYTGNRTACEDVDECTLGTHNCDSKATCSNTTGSFICTCNDGYTGNGTTCEDINECVGASRKCSGAGQECVNYPGAYRCHCTSPRQHIIDEECTDIQASVEGQFVIINRVYIPAYNDPQSLEYFQITELVLIELTNLYTRTARLRFTFQRCIILRLFPGSVGFDYVATFNDSAGINSNNIKDELVNSMNFTQNGTFLGAYLQISESADRTEVKGLFSVKDVNECLQAPCGINSICTNTEGSYVCGCHIGYERNAETTNCADVDECAIGLCSLNANCTNTNGSYFCVCKSGYEGNGRICLDVDECAEAACGLNSNCTNTIGSYLCECQVGFNGNGRNCADINECERDAPCHTNATCTNVDGSYYCACKADYGGDGFFCEALVCTVDAIYYATTSAIKGVFSDGNSTVTILSATNVKLNYDSGTKRLIYYDGSKLITVKLDGSDPITIRGSLTTLDRFTVDHIKRKVYFITNLFRKVSIVDLDTGNLTDLNPTDIVNADDLDSDPTNSTLVFADIENGDIVRYYLDKDTQEIIYHSNTSPKYLAVDSQYEVIYWIDYISATNSFSLMKTHFNGSTSQIKLYSGVTSSVNVAIGEDYFYTMDSTRQSIDRFDRPTATFQASFDLSDKPQEITVVQGG
ncbi:fibrillin-2-like [Dendronephthya gigantea]|uniref:fibrillin-2-like n=1 Tax=Dendronephthya gigantea TaxID=151771 RepID=UPI00106C1722|nr:fibrillin-2-like [Dendronephthya gigantea]